MNDYYYNNIYCDLITKHNSIESLFDNYISNKEMLMYFAKNKLKSILDVLKYIFINSLEKIFHVIIEENNRRVEIRIKENNTEKTEETNGNLEVEELSFHDAIMMCKGNLQRLYLNVFINQGDYLYSDKRRKNILTTFWGIINTKLKIKEIKINSYFDLCAIDSLLTNYFDWGDRSYIYENGNLKCDVQEMKKVKYTYFCIFSIYNKYELNKKNMNNKGNAKNFGFISNVRNFFSSVINSEDETNYPVEVFSKSYTILNNKDELEKIDKLFSIYMCKMMIESYKNKMGGTIFEIKEPERMFTEDEQINEFNVDNMVVKYKCMRFKSFFSFGKIYSNIKENVQKGLESFRSVEKINIKINSLINNWINFKKEENVRKFSFGNTNETKENIEKEFIQKISGIVDNMSLNISHFPNLTNLKISNCSDVEIFNQKVNTIEKKDNEENKDEDGNESEDKDEDESFERLEVFKMENVKNIINCQSSIKNLCKKIKHAKEITIVDCDIDSSILMTIINQCKELRKITIKKCPNISMKIFDSTFISFINEKKIENNVSINYPFNPIVDHYDEIKRSYKNIIELSLNLKDNHPYKKLESIKYIPSENVIQEAFKQTNRSFNPKTINFLFPTCLKKLSLKFSGDFTYTDIVNSLYNNRNYFIESLKLDSFNANEIFAQDVMKKMVLFPKIKTLKFENIKKPNNLEIFLNLKEMKTIENLHLLNNTWLNSNLINRLLFKGNGDYPGKEIKKYEMKLFRFNNEIEVMQSHMKELKDIKTDQERIDVLINELSKTLQCERKKDDCIKKITNKIAENTKNIRKKKEVFFSFPDLSNLKISNTTIDEYNYLMPMHKVLVENIQTINFY